MIPIVISYEFRLVILLKKLFSDSNNIDQRSVALINHIIITKFMESNRNCNIIQSVSQKS